MLRPARRSWLLALVLLLGGGAAWLLLRAERPEAAGTVDAGRTSGASPRPLLLGRDPRAASAEAARSAAAAPKREQAVWRVLRPDGTPAAGAHVEYRPIDRPDLGFEGSTSDAGLLAVEPEAAGERCLVSVREEPAWAPGRFDRFALGVSTLELSAGCEVWLELDADHAELVGQRATILNPESETRPVVLAGVRTRLGRFAGSLTVLRVGRTPAAASLQNVLLPPSGSVTLRFEARPIPPLCRLRFRSPAGATTRPRFTLATLDDFPAPIERPDLRLDVAQDITELAVAAGGLTVLAECEGRWAFAEVLAQPADEPVEVPLDWQTGGELEVRWPTEPPWMVSLELLSDPRTGNRQDLPGLSSDSDPQPGSLHLDWNEVHSPAGEWPGFPAREGPRSSLWRGLPRGARVRVWLSETPWGTLSEDAAIPLDGGRALLDVRAGARFEVQAVAADGTVLDRLFVLLHGTGEGAFQPQATWTAGGAAQVTGVRPGTEVQVALSDEAWAGAATAVVSDGLVLRVPVARRPRARYRARLVDEQGAPLAGLGVRLGAGGEAGRLVLSGPDGWAEADLYRDHGVYASSAHPGWTSESVLVAPGGAGTVVARAARDLEVVFDVGDRSVTALCQEVGEDGQAGASSESTLRVLPGSVLRVGVQSRVPRMRVRVEAPGPGGALLLFDEVLRLEPSGATTVHVRP